MQCSSMLLCTTLAALRLVAAADIGVCGAAGDSSMDPSCRPSPTAGNALVQWRRTLTEVKAGDGDVATGASSEDGVANAKTVQGSPCVGSGCGDDTKANQTEALVAVPDPSNISANETSPHISANETSPSRNVSKLPGIEPRIAQERIEPFGYPGAGLVVELHLPKVTLRELHTSSRGSLAQFLLEVRDELGKGAQVQESRLSILGIHGRYKRYNSDGYFRMRSDRTDHMAGSEHMEEEVVVRFEILPGWAQDPDPQSALNVLKHQLSSPDSGLLRGPLGTTLLNATVTLSSSAGMASSPGMTEHHGMGHMSAMAWPIGISAAFIGVLIWLAAY